jgi:hypothetical protein
MAAKIVYDAALYLGKIQVYDADVFFIENICRRQTAISYGIPGLKEIQ